MFDNVICKYKLPDKEAQELEFQTKDFECLLENYVIEEDGTISKELHDREWVEDEKMVLGGYYKSVKSWWVKEPYHGYVNIYTFVSEGDDTIWYDYQLKFTDDVLVEIKKLR